MGGAKAMSCCIAPLTSVVATIAHIRNWNPASSSTETTRSARFRAKRRRRRLRIARLFPVVAEEDVLELRLGKNEIAHACGRKQPEQRIQIAPHPKHRLAAIDLGARNLGQTSKSIRHV